MNIIVLMLLQQHVKAEIYYDIGQYTGFDSNACDAGSSQTKTISFSSTFQKVPQVFYGLTKFSLQNSSVVEDAQVKSEIVSITTINFQVKVSCPLSSGLSSSYQFQWYATCVPRITVLRSSIIPTPKNGDIYTHNHTNSLATQGFVMFTDLEYKEPFHFYLTVQSVTSSQVKIKFTSTDNKAFSVGYFVVIGPANAFDLTILYKTASGSAYNLFSNSALTVPTDGILLFPSPGFGWSSGLPQILITITQNVGSSTASCQVGTYSPTTTTGVYYCRVWMTNRVIYPMYVHKFRVAQIESLIVDVPIKVILNGQTYNQIGKYLQNIPAATQIAPVQIFMQFFPNTKLYGTFLKCNNCGSNFNYVVKKYYLNSINMITFNLIIQQYLTYDVKDLEITITSTGVLIKSLATVSDDKATVVNLQFQNIF